MGKNQNPGPMSYTRCSGSDLYAQWSQQGLVSVEFEVSVKLADGSNLVISEFPPDNLDKPASIIDES